jgi:RNA polymerase sigma-70 factor, ECF subfamily
MLSEQSSNLDPALQNQTDAELIFALRNGQTPAMAVLYDRHSGLVYGLALKTLGNTQEAEDLTQEVFITLVKSTAYDPRRGSLRTFLAVLTKSRALDRLRSRSSARQLISRWQQNKTPEPTSNIPLERAFQSEQSQEVKAALAQLPEATGFTIGLLRRIESIRNCQAVGVASRNSKNQSQTRSAQIASVSRPFY